MLALLHPEALYLRRALPHLALLLASLFVASVIKRGWVDPRYPGVDWELTREKLLLYALKCVKSSGLDAEEAVQYALEKAYLPTARPWDPKEKSILLYLGSYANTKIAHMRKSLHHRRMKRGVDLTPEVAETLGALDTDPVSVLRDGGDEKNAERIFLRLKEALDGHRLPLYLLSIYEDRAVTSPDESTTRALGRGFSEKEIAAARQKIHREIVKLMNEEALADQYGTKAVLA